jgi:hypothetical protein
MKTLLLDQTAWDLVLDANGNIAVADDPYSIAQDVASAVRTFAGECSFDTKLGMPYWSKILGHLPPLSLIRESIKVEALRIKGVNQVQVVFDRLDQRRLTGQIQIIDDEANASGVIF